MGRLLDFKRLAVGAALVLGFSLSVQGNCLYEGQSVWCQWGNGCFSINNLHPPNVGADCAALIAHCQDAGAMFTGVTNVDASNNWGEGVTCNGTQVGGALPTGMFCDYGTCVGSINGGDGCATGGCYPQKQGETCSGGSVVALCPCANLPPNQAAAGAPCDGTIVEPVEMCLWSAGGGCWPITDEAERANCVASGWVFLGGTEGAASMCEGGTFTGDGRDPNPPTTPQQVLGCCLWAVETSCNNVYSEQEVLDCSGGGNQFWPVACPTNTANNCPPSTSVNSCPFAKFASVPLRASYSRGGVSVNWNAPSNISSGTISLVNVRGVTVASTSVRASSNNVSATLGTKAALPTGMYFIRVDARDVSGKRIVQQVPVQIVK